MRDTHLLPTLLLVASLAAGVVFVSGCGDDELNLNPGFISASTTTVDFGDVFLGSSEQRTVSLYNRGEKPVVFVVPEDGLLGGVFNASAEALEILPNQEVIVELIFAPGRVTSYETSLTLDNDSFNDPVLTLILRGDGRSSDPCFGITCNNPPPSACSDSQTALHFLPAGTCINGGCEYTTSTEPCPQWGCDFDTGLCRTDPCAGTACTTPPASACLDTNTSRHYSAAGSCAEGVCTYPVIDEACAFGCDFTTGLCEGDPCQGVVCQTPPGPCFQANGTCTGGACQYAINNGASCTDDDPCTLNDTCNSGICSGTVNPCSTPPAAQCLDRDTLRLWAPAGTCVADGRCTYDFTDTFCQFGCDNGACNGDPCAGGCDDGNPCTADSCEAGIGCVNTPQAGSCVSNSSACPAGVCSGGTCLPKAGEICQAKYDVDLCQDATVAGVCTGAGQCEVTEVPPEYYCPDCNGICLQCYFLQICIPLF